MSYAMDQWAGIASDWAARRQQESYEKAIAAERAGTRRAEFWHGETLAVLVAALAEIRRIQSDNILLIPQVEARIRRAGSEALKKQTKGQNFWQPVWDLKFDLSAVLREVQEEHEAARALAIKKLGLAIVEEKRYFWRPWRKYGRIKVGSFKFKFPTKPAAEEARKRALELAQKAALGGELGIARLLRAQ